MDLSSPFSYMFKDPSWFFKVLAGGLCLVFSWTIIGFALFLGYQVHAIDAVIHNEDHYLPEWKNFFRYLKDGFSFLLLMCLYMIPIALIVLIVFHCPPVSCIIIFSASWFLLQPVTSIQFVPSMSLRGCLTVKPFTLVFKQFPVVYVTTVAISFLTFVGTAAFGWMSLIIGWPLVLFWGSLVQAHLTAQFVQSSRKQISNRP